MKEPKDRTSDYCCIDCGKEYVKDKKPIITIVTFHTGICGICGETKSITHIRVYNYLQLSSPKHIIDNGSK